MADDFCKEFPLQQEKCMVDDKEHKHRNKPNRMSDAEIMVIFILFHSGGFRCFKHYYKEYVCKHLDEPFGHFLVRESQPIDVEFFVTILYREVATLVNHGNGIVLERLHVCQCLCGHFLARQVGQTEVVVFR